MSNIIPFPTHTPQVPSSPDQYTNTPKPWKLNESTISFTDPDGNEITIDLEPHVNLTHNPNLLLLSSILGAIQVEVENNPELAEYTCAKLRRILNSLQQKG